MKTDHTWHQAHPHARDKAWTKTGLTWRTEHWTWAKCSCGQKTAVMVAVAGEPICDGCFTGRFETPAPSPKGEEGSR